MTDIQQRITDILFTETARIVLADTGKDVEQRVAAVMSLLVTKLAEVLVSELGLTKMHETGDTSGSFQYVTPWQKPDE